MRRVGNLIETVADWQNLRRAVIKALRGKRSRLDARCYVANLEANLNRLRGQILSNSMPVGRFHQFTIHDPKKRLITAPCFEERVLHHALMNVCEPIFERVSIHDSYACRKGKGRVACLLRAQQYARGFPYFLKIDIRKYFDSVDHGVLVELLSRRFKDQRLLALFIRIIQGYQTAPGKGLPIGSLTSQHFANYYLGSCDRFIKETRRISGYARYMDDMALWAPFKTELRETLLALTDYLGNHLRLLLKPEPYLNRTTHGMDFLGCRIFPTHQVLNRRSGQRFRQRLKAIDSAVTVGKISELDAQQRATAVVSFARTPGVKSWRLRQRMLLQIQGE